MEEAVIKNLGVIYEHAIFFYCIALFSIYLVLTVFSRLVIHKNRFFTHYRRESTILSSPIAPGISVIAPAFNEALNIIGNVRSLLTLDYPLFEVIIVNDGSTDGTLEVLIEEFSLTKVDFAYNALIETRPVRGIYRSTQKGYAKLTVIDKVNGKCKADAANAGLNIAHHPYFLNTDVDCVLDNKTLVKLIRPILEELRPVIAVGAGLRIANSCEIDGGMMTMVKAPTALLPRFQELEYIRSFIMGKLGWSYINSVPNVSGGLGLFKKDVALRAGGYDSKSFAEDMDIVVRMIKNCIESGEPYAVRYIPETLCWTEAPESLSVFVRQRVRWSRGLWQIFATHFKVLFNPKYKRLGVVVFPYNFLFELLAPIIEVLGILFYICIILLALVNWQTAIILLVFVYIYMVVITLLSVLWDQFVFKQYKSWKVVVNLSFMAFIEPLLYHPIVLYSSLKGYLYQLVGKKHSWGNMQRKGFANTILPLISDEKK
ncbi:glycosyltransferase family 2 protein [Chryseobacterium sp. A301]